MARPSHSEILTTRELAARWKISSDTVIRLADIEGLPHALLNANGNGKRLRRFDADQVDQWFAGRVARSRQDVTRYRRVRDRMRDEE